MARRLPDLRRWASVKYHEMQGDVEDLEGGEPRRSHGGLGGYGSIAERTAPTFDLRRRP